MHLERFTALPDDETLAATVVALEELGPASPSSTTSTRRVKPAPGFAAYGQNSYIGKILEIRQELPGRIRIVLIRRSIGF